MAASMTDTTPLQPYLAQHEALQAQAAGWLEGLRNRGMQQLAEAGLPTPRLEAWKYTNLRPLQKHDFAAAPAEGDGPRIDRIPSLQPAAETTHRLVFVNGRFRDELSHLGSLPAGVTVGSLAALLRDQSQRLEPHLGQLGNLDGQPMMALNTALMEDGFVLLLDEGVVLAEPIDVVFIAAADARPLAFHPRNLMVLGRDSQATVLEHHAGQGTQHRFGGRVRGVWRQCDQQPAGRRDDIGIRRDGIDSLDGISQNLGVHRCRVLGLREAARSNLGRVGRQGRLHLVAEVECTLGVTRNEVGVQTQQVVEDLNLSVTSGARSDSRIAVHRRDSLLISP